MRRATILVLFAIVFAACDREPPPPPEALPPAEALAALRTRIWIDDLPETWSDRFNIFIFDSELGIFQSRTIWKGDFELFQYTAKDYKLDVKLPGSNKHVKTTFRVERVASKDPSDLRLVFEAPPRGPAIYWGFEIERDRLDAWLEKSATPLAE